MHESCLRATTTSAKLQSLQLSSHQNTTNSVFFRVLSVRGSRLARKELQAPDPLGGWSTQIVPCNDAIVVPPVWAGPKQRAGILKPNGGYIAQGSTWRYERVTTAVPKPVHPSQTVPGTWLWAGVLFDHFGHFLTESLTRMWAWYHLTEPVAGICYMPKRPGRGGELRSYQTQVLAAFGVDVPVHLVTEPTQFESLIVPGQGFGLGAISTGTPLMRQAVRAHFGVTIQPDGPERLYLSRSRLDPAAGAIMGEVLLEDRLRAEGYEIFHPQDHDIPTQIARYKAARKLIIADGSTGHLFAFVGREHQQIAYLLRRRFWIDGPINHIASFCGSAPLVLDTFCTEWQPVAPDTSARGVVYVQHSMNALHAALLKGRFVSQTDPWPEPGEDLSRSYLERTGALSLFHDVAGMEKAAG